MKLLIPPIYVLHVDGVGEYAMRREDGTRCMFVFTSKDTIAQFVELMERPEHKDFTAIPLDTSQLITTFLSEIKQHTQMIAVDPPANCEFAPVAIDDLIAFQIHDT